MSLSFNPNTVGQHNGNYFALPSYPIYDAEIMLLSVPWDATASYGTGAHKAPEAIIKASTQIDLYDAEVKDAWTIKIATHPVDEAILRLNRSARRFSSRVITAMGEGVPERRLIDEIVKVNELCDKLNMQIYKAANKYLDARKLVGIVGGEHSAPFGLLRALNERHDEFGVLHIDAHADLRDAYEGFMYSHASIMFNVLDQLRHVTKIVQVGVRDYCDEEAARMAANARVVPFTDAALQEAAFNGVLWAQQCRDIVAALPEKVYISFDIDGLTPDNCPNTGTPVPGGLTYNQAIFLLKTLAKSGKKIIGFDLCEVAPSEHNEWDANVGARVLFKLCAYTSGRIVEN
ncbi:MAG: agmatinase family protein [Prevotellaceae bacterium]|jgi:agmatinase|nr:agmatinase family protein [Prevotellaceae bacterium]